MKRMDFFARQGAGPQPYFIPFATSATPQATRKTNAHAGCGKIGALMRGDGLCACAGCNYLPIISQTGAGS